MSQKEFHQKTHKIAVLAYLMSEVLDEINADSTQALNFKSKCDQIQGFCETILTESFSVKTIKSTTYLQELSNKVDTVIRKNYQQIKE